LLIYALPRATRISQEVARKTIATITAFRPEGEHRRQRVHLPTGRGVGCRPDHLAVDLRELGEQERARELHEQALAMYQRLAERRSVPGH
jgi:Tetratricopeptide repeat